MGEDLTQLFSERKKGRGKARAPPFLSSNTERGAFCLRFVIKVG